MPEGSTPNLRNWHTHTHTHTHTPQCFDQQAQALCVQAPSPHQLHPIVARQNFQACPVPSLHIAHGRDLGSAELGVHAHIPQGPTAHVACHKHVQYNTMRKYQKHRCAMPNMLWCPQGHTCPVKKFTGLVIQAANSCTQQACHTHDFGHCIAVCQKIVASTESSQCLLPANRVHECNSCNNMNDQASPRHRQDQDVSQSSTSHLTASGTHYHIECMIACKQGLNGHKIEFYLLK